MDYAGTTWSGEISHLLELGPFQARARKGNTAVPYIQDFHLRLNFAEQPSKFDVTNPPYTTTDGPTKSAFAGRTMAPKLLEFATLANFLHKGEIVRSMQGWPAGFTFTYTAQPYLEVTYTKHESGLRDSYNLRCFEHLYEKSQRFRLEAPDKSLESPSVLSRVTSRLLSNPTKIYVWAEVADEFKYPYAMGGVRRSCTLENLHLESKPASRRYVQPIAGRMLRDVSKTHQLKSGIRLLAEKSDIRLQYGRCWATGHVRKRRSDYLDGMGCRGQVNNITNDRTALIFMLRTNWKLLDME